MIETRPRSSAAAWSATPRICAPRPSSQTHWVSSTRNDFGWRKETPARLSAAFCHSVAARAKQKAAEIARSVASSSTAPGGYRGRRGSGSRPSLSVDM